MQLFFFYSKDLYILDIKKLHQIELCHINYIFKKCSKAYRTFLFVLFLQMQKE